jgi:ribosomal protein RSM22 (predicted rRNA methylase)
MSSSINYPKRIHIAPVGFEVDRVVLPVLDMRADRVWLISEQNPELDQGRSYLEQVAERINEKNENCDIRIRRCDFDNRDLYDVLKAYREIIQEEKENQIFINVSTGTKINAIAGMMACMIFKDSVLS